MAVTDNEAARQRLLIRRRHQHGKNAKGSRCDALSKSDQMSAPRSTRYSRIDVIHAVRYRRCQQLTLEIGVACPFGAGEGKPARAGFFVFREAKVRLSERALGREAQERPSAKAAATCGQERRPRSSAVIEGRCRNGYGRASLQGRAAQIAAPNGATARLLGNRSRRADRRKPQRARCGYITTLSFSSLPVPTCAARASRPGARALRAVRACGRAPVPEHQTLRA